MSNIIHLAHSKWSKSPATHWSPSKPLPPLHYTQVCPVNSTLDTHCNRVTRISALPQARPTSHITSVGQEMVSFPKVEKWNAWEEKQSTSPLESERCTAAEEVADLPVQDTDSLPQMHKKTVSFSRKMPTYRKTNGQPSSSKHSAMYVIYSPCVFATC